MRIQETKYSIQHTFREQGRTPLDIPPNGVAVSPAVARRNTNVYLGSTVTMMTMSGDPVLVCEPRPHWRVPIMMGMPSHDIVTPIGTVQVDALTGDVKALSDEQIDLLKVISHAVAFHYND